MSSHTKRSTRSTRQASAAAQEAEAAVETEPNPSSQPGYDQAEVSEHKTEEQVVEQLKNESQYASISEEHMTAEESADHDQDPNQAHSQTGTQSAQPEYYQSRADSGPHEGANSIPHGAQSAHTHHYGAPLGTLEPSAERYQLQAGNGRRGSTDPVLHASLVAAATANVAANGERRPSISNSYSYEDPGSYYPQYPPPQPFNGPGSSSYPMMPPHQHPSEIQNQQQQHLQMNQQPHSSHPHYQPQMSDMNATASSSSSSHLEGEGTDGGPVRRSTGAQLGTNNHPGLGRKETPYSRSPDMRVTHATAERKRRKDMKDLFDELRTLLPTDKGPKSSKWEILSKAVEALKAAQEQEAQLLTDNDHLREELAAYRGGAAAYGNVGHAHQGNAGTEYRASQENSPYPNPQ